MKAWRFFSIGTTELKFHPMLALYGLYAAASGHGIYFLLSLISVALHECAHGICSAVLGNPPDCIELTPLGAVMRVEDEHRLSTIRHLIMLLAGPGTTFLLCIMSIYLVKVQWLSADLGRMLLMCNLAILIVNLLPVLPLDGGRLLALILGICFSLRIVARIMRIIGYSLGLGLIALNVLSSWKYGNWNLSLSFIGCTLLYCAHSALTTSAMAELRSFLERKIRLERHSRLRIKWMSTLEQVHLRQLVRQLPTNHFAVYLCLEAGTMKTMGALTEADVIKYYLEKPELKVGKLLKMYPMVDILHHLDTK